MPEVLQGVQEGLRNAWQNVIEFTPRLIGALLILLIGWLACRVLRAVIRGVLQRTGFDRLLERAGLAAALREAGYTASGVVAGILYWIALLIVFLLAAEALQVPTLTQLLQGLISYLPLVIAAIIVLVVAAAVGGFLGDLVRPWAEQRGIGWLGTASRWALVLLGGFLALNTLNLADAVVNTLFTAIVGAVAVAFAIAFGVGGIDAARSYWRRVGDRAQTSRQPTQTG